MSVTKTTKCPRCFGAGRDAAGKTCSLCKGSGEVTQKPGSRSLSRIQPRRDNLNGASPPSQQSKPLANFLGFRPLLSLCAIFVSLGVCSCL